MTHIREQGKDSFGILTGIRYLMLESYLLNNRAQLRLLFYCRLEIAACYIVKDHGFGRSWNADCVEMFAIVRHRSQGGLVQGQHKRIC